MLLEEVAKQLQWTGVLLVSLLIAFLLGRWLVHLAGYKGNMSLKSDRLLSTSILVIFSFIIYIFVLRSLTRDLLLVTQVGVLNTVLMTFALGLLVAKMHIRIGRKNNFSWFARWFYKVRK